jgi:hypothetical protein
MGSLVPRSGLSTSVLLLLIAGLSVIKLGALLWFAYTITEEIDRERHNAEDHD